MSSLSSHLTAGLDHGRLRFRPDCPVCREQRLAGTLSDALLSDRARAALLAAALGAGTLLPSAVAVASERSNTPPASASHAPRRPRASPPKAAPTPAPEEAPLGTDETQEAPADEAPELRELLTSPEAGTDTRGEDVSGEAEETVPAPPLEEPAPAEPAPAPAPVGQPPAEPGPVEPAPVPVEQPPPRPVPPAAPPRSSPTPLAQQSPEPVEPTPSAQSEQLSAPHPVRPRATHRPPEPRGDIRRSAAQPGPKPAAPPRHHNAVPRGLVVRSTNTTPASISRASEPPSTSASGGFYTVRPGDSLWSIARRLLGPAASPARIAQEVNRLWELNRDRIRTGDPSLIHVGTVLRLT
jgi:LysM domain